MNGFGVIRAIGRRLTRLGRDESGAAALILAAAILTVGFTALAIFLQGAQSGRELAQAKGNGAAEAKIKNALIAYYLADTGSGAPHRLPCPDTAVAPTGVAAVTCVSDSATYIGVLPWQTLNLSRADAIDAYGNFYTYVVSGRAALAGSSNGICESVTKASAFGGDQEFTGRLLSFNLEALLTDQTAGAGNTVPYAVIGHGPNGRGALGGGATFRAAPTSSLEQANQASSNGSSYVSAPTAVFVGPRNITSAGSTTYFDDQVSVPSTLALEKMCGQLTPGGAINAMLTDNFNDNAQSARNFGNMATNGTGVDGVTIGASADGSGNRVARFVATGAATSYLVTNSRNFDFTPTVRPIYISTKWRASSSRFSIATRGTTSQLIAGNDFISTGVTVQFNHASNSIVVLLDGAAPVQPVNLTVSGGLTITSGRNYKLEVYDNGSDVWARITDVLDATQYATAYVASMPSSTYSGQVFFINGTVASELDDILIGFPMLAMETTGTNSYAAAAGNAANGVSTGSLTLEAWVRPRSFPTSGDATIVGKWDTAAVPNNQGFRLRMNSSGTVFFDASVRNGGTNTASIKNYAGPTLAVGEWSHIAVTFAFNDGATTDTETVAFFKDGDQYSSSVTGVDTPTGINDTTTGAAPLFVVGAATDAGVPGDDGFNGAIADVRVWRTARTAPNIRDNFQARLSAVAADTSVDDLIVNWRLDSESLTGAGLASTTAVVTPAKGTAGTLTSAIFVPSLSQYFRPISSSFCPDETIAGAYQCDFRVATDGTGAAGLAYNDTSGSPTATAPITVPSNLIGLYAKVWGAGGGGFDTATDGNDTGAGSGGYSAGFLQSIDSTAIPGEQLDLYIGGFGSRNTSVNMGGGGGAGSGIYLHSGTVAGLVAGGGGGASFSNQGSTCPSTWDTSCGLGGNGEGATIASTTSHAPDQSLGCGGRGGNNTTFISDPTDVPLTGTNCPDGGDDTPVGLPRRGGGGTSGGPAGGGNLLSGGRGYDASVEPAAGSPNANTVGGGGGGGGDNGAGQGGAEAGAYRKTQARRGYGGGGGAGTADSGVSNATGATGTYMAAADVRTGIRNSGQTTISSISPSVSTTGWQVGDTINAGGTQIPDCTTITAIDTLNNTITLSQAATSGTNASTTLTVPADSKPVSRPGGSTDYYLNPSYVTVSPGYQFPARGGTSVSGVSSSSCADGGGGVIVLLW